MARSLGILLLLLSFGCGGGKVSRRDAGPVDGDGGILVDAAMEDGGTTPSDGGDPERDSGTPMGALSRDLEVARVDAFQAVAIPLVQDGAEVAGPRTLVAGRDVLFRVHASALPTWSPREIHAVLTIGGERFEDVRTPALPADDTRPTSLFAIRVPGRLITADARWSLRLEDPRGGEETGNARYPSDGSTAALGAQVTTPMHLVLVPFRYDTDGSGRLPDTSEAQLDRMRAELTARFPYAEVTIEVHAVTPWNRGLRFNNNVDWGDVNQTLIEMRDAESAPEHQYWYGLMAPHGTRSSYCDSTFGTCVTGQSYVATVDGTRVGSGVGFGDLDTIGTLAHELGHLHGRFHAPCGTSGTDADYPYSGGRIGVWGWDPRDGSFLDPDDHSDLLGYCDPQWVSDYTWNAMFERQADLRAEYALRFAALRTLRFVTVGDEGVRSAERRVRRLPGARMRGIALDAEGLPMARVDVGKLELAHGGDVVYAFDAPEGARELVVDGRTIGLTR
ncbi:MAG: M66 family metalloprotease [Polyangiales bacterium]|nr:hypothetical protein [Sandaracinus sp.]